jgi:hypothetical protein
MHVPLETRLQSGFSELIIRMEKLTRQTVWARRLFGWSEAPLAIETGSTDPSVLYPTKPQVAVGAGRHDRSKASMQAGRAPAALPRYMLAEPIDTASVPSQPCTLFVQMIVPHASILASQNN